MNQQSSISNVGLLFGWARRLRGRRVELLDGVAGQVEAWFGPDDTGVGGAKEDLEPLFLRELFEDREQSLLEFVLQLLLQLVDFGLRVLLEALALALLPLDFLLELRPRLLVHQRAALL